MQKQMVAEAKEIQNRIADFQLFPMDTRKIEKSTKGGIYFSGNRIEKTGANDLLNILGLRNDFFKREEKNKIATTSRYPEFFEALSKFHGKRTLTGVTDKSNKKIVRILDQRIEEPEPLNLDNQLAVLMNYAESIREDMPISCLKFNDRLLRIEAIFLDPKKEIQVLDLKEDRWKYGIGILSGLAKCQVIPAFLRLLCTNQLTGNTVAKNHYFLDSDKINDRSFTKFMNKARREDYGDLCRKSCLRLHKTNASVNEVFAARAIFGVEDEELTKIGNKYFGVKSIKEAYEKVGFNLTDESGRFLSHANSGVNAYDFFNNCTAVASHEDVDGSVASRLNELASSMFFKGPDLSNLPPNPFGKN